MKAVTMKELKMFNSEDIKASIPFWVVSEGERIALVIHPSKYELFTRIADIVEHPERFPKIPSSVKGGRHE